MPWLTTKRTSSGRALPPSTPPGRAWEAMTNCSLSIEEILPFRPMGAGGVATFIGHSRPSSMYRILAGDGQTGWGRAPCLDPTLESPMACAETLKRAPADLVA